MPWLGKLASSIPDLFWGGISPIQKVTVASSGRRATTSDGSSRSPVVALRPRSLVASVRRLATAHQGRSSLIAQSRTACRNGLPALVALPPWTDAGDNEQASDDQ